MPGNCLVLYSGGLDSILVCRILQEQGITPLAVRFITPFFGWSLKGNEEAEADRAYGEYGIRLIVKDISAQYLKMVTSPVHGYGRYMNPCIDCKILMVKTALSMMETYNASFLATGEVLGQRPMSQRRDTLRIIERDSGAEGLLLRPLSARLLPETIVEKKGIVKRNLLPAVSGRGRKVQIALAKKYGITHYPAPAGGCVLADPILSRRFKRIFSIWPSFTLHDCLIARKGRHFLLEDRSWVITGRKQSENIELEKLALPSDVILRPLEVPGPLCILRHACSKRAIETAARIAARYSKASKGQPFKVLARRVEDGFEKTIQVTEPAGDQELDLWRF